MVNTGIYLNFINIYQIRAPTAFGAEERGRGECTRAFKRALGDLGKPVDRDYRTANRSGGQIQTRVEQ